MIKGFFFDLDGTLVDTHQANFEAYKQALSDFGVVIDFEMFRKFIGEQAQIFLPKLAPELDDRAYEDIALKKAVYYKNFVHLTKLNQTLVSFIEAIHLHHVTALVTTAKQKNADTVLQHHELEKYFDFIITANDVAKSKPAPDPYLLALKMSGLTCNEVITFEDSEPGLSAAEAAGIPVVLIRDFVT